MCCKYSQQSYSNRILFLFFFLSIFLFMPQAEASHQPDLRLASWSAPTSSPGYRSKITLSFQIRNDGKSNAGRFYVGFYYSDNTTTNSLHYLNRYLFASGLAKKTTSSTLKLTLVLPSNVLHGNRYIHYYVDYTNSIVEHGESNNRGYRKLAITGLPNLEVTYLRRTPSSQWPSGKVMLVYRVYNSGLSRTTSSFTLAFYDSSDLKITTGDRLLIGSHPTLSVLNALSSKSGQGTFALPNVPPGTRYLGAYADSSQKIRESSETDNSQVTHYQALLRAADLKLYLWNSTPTTSGSGSKVTVTIRVQNVGPIASGKFSIAFYYNDSSSTTGLLKLSSITISSLAANALSQSTKLILTLPARAAYGIRYLHYWIDDGLAIKEVNENNNRGFSPIWLTGNPNLIVSALTLSPSGQIPNGYVTLYYTVKNIGETRTAQSIYFRFYFSVDKRITSTDTYVGQTTLATLNAGESKKGTYRVRTPSTALAGQRYFGAFVDFGNRVSESSESDNTRSAPIQIFPTSDLSLSSLTMTQSTIGSGAKLSIRYKVINRGSATKGFYTSFYYGDTSTSSNLTYLGRSYITRMGANAISSSESLVLTLPSNVLYGARAINYYIDYTRSVAETNESNNRGYRKLQITGKPDLQISRLQISPNSQASNGRLQINFRIYNAGHSRISGKRFITRIYHSLDSKIQTSDTYLNREIQLSTLYAKSSYPSASDIITTVTLPSNAPRGSSYIGVLADYSQQIAESSENNNFRSTKLNVIRGIADFAMDSFTTSSSAIGAGSNVMLTFKLSNSGNADSLAFEVHFYYSDNTGFRKNLPLLGRYTVRSLRQKSTTGTIRYRVRLPTQSLFGIRYIHYRIDALNQVKEKNKSNNNGSSPLSITGRPNLQVSALTISPTNQVAGRSLTTSYRVYNAGSTRTPASIRLRFYFSNDSIITTKDTYIKREIRIPILFAKSSYPSTTNGKTSVTIPSSVSSGTRYIGAYIDYNDQLPESSEADNSRAAKVQILATPDLSMDSWSTASSIRGSGSKMTVKFQVRNRGSETNGFYVAFYYNDSSARQGLRYLERKWIPRVGTNTKTSTQQQVLILPPQVLFGKRYLHYIIDYRNQIRESNERNNRGHRVLSITGKPDLIVLPLKIQPSSQEPNKPVQLSFKIQNQGYSKVNQGFVARIYYSNDAKLTISDLYLNQERKLKGLDARSTWPTKGNGVATVTIPSTALAGGRFIGIFVDVNKKINEANESNNTTVAKINISGTIDLIAISLTASPTQQLAGKSVKLTYQIQNIGNQQTKSLLRFYFSSDQKVTTTDTLIASLNLTIPGKQQVTQSQTITLPTTLKASKGYLGIFIDPLNNIKEFDESNNTKTTPFELLSDQDKDGFASNKDCNDKDKTVYPGAKEVCDTKDNNCNGKIDEGCQCTTGKARNCYSGGIECKRQTDGRYQCKAPCKSGKQSCIAGKWGACKGETKPSVEICDGKDNDCDGNIDEALSRSCYSGPLNTASKGLCKEGAQECIGGHWGLCKGEIKPVAEICDGKDNNCNGQIDESLIRKCYNGPSETKGKGICKEGTQLCKSGQWDLCLFEVTPQTESCDGKDNDCDGKVDNQPNSAPLARSCASQCGQGDELCIQAKWTNCTAPSCEKQTETVKEQVKENNHEPNEFTDAGENRNEAPSIEEAPEQRSCYQKGCPSGQVCLQGSCQLDPCSGISCRNNEFCRSGQCIKACGCKKCASSEKCIDGNCILDPCAKVSCSQSEVCDPSKGKCVTDPCLQVNCPPKTFCAEGVCLDEPCSLITCPSGQKCSKGQCIGNRCTASESREEVVPESENQEEKPDSSELFPEEQTETPESKEKPEKIKKDTTSTQPEQTNLEKNTGADPSSSSDQRIQVTGCGCEQSNPSSIPMLFLTFFFIIFYPSSKRKKS